MSAQLKAEAEAKFPRFPAQGGEDHLAWAKRFVYRDERGDKDLLRCQVKSAYEALGREVPAR